jgi:hypothetical protein
VPGRGGVGEERVREVVMEPWRSVFGAERRVLGRLLAVELPGRDALRLQLDDLQDRVIDKNGSLELKRQTGPVAHVAQRVPVNGRYFDQETGDEFSPP